MILNLNKTQYMFIYYRLRKDQLLKKDAETK